jgi:hypothetical protein
VIHHSPIANKILDLVGAADRGELNERDTAFARDLAKYWGTHPRLSEKQEVWVDRLLERAERNSHRDAK